MKKFISFLLCLALCFNLIPTIMFAEDPEPYLGPFEGLDDPSGIYTISEDLLVTSVDAITLVGGKVRIESGATLTIEAGGSLELRGTELTNDGTIIIKADTSGDPPEYGHLEIWEVLGVLLNNGLITVNGELNLSNDAQLINIEGKTVEISGKMRLHGGAEIVNTGSGMIIGIDDGKIDLFDPPDEVNPPFVITGLSFYEDAEAEEAIEELSGLFRYDHDSKRWVRHNEEPGGGDPPPGDMQYSITLNYDEEQGRIILNGAFETSGVYHFNENDNVHMTIEASPGYQIEDVVIDGESQDPIDSYSFENLDDDHTVEVTFIAEPPGDGSIHTITVHEPVNGSVTADGLSDGIVEVEDGYDIIFMVTPNPGYRISAVMITENGFTDDWSWNLAYLGNGDFEFPLFEVRGDMDIEFVFEAEDLESLLENNFVVLEEETESYSDIAEALIKQFSGYGYAVSADDIEIIGVDKGEINTKGYGEFTFAVTTADESTGYIVKSPSDIIFKLDDGNESVIKVVRPSEDPDIDELAVPAMSSGTMEVFGYGNLVAAPMTDLERDENGRIKLPFNCAQFHIFNFMPPGDGNVNLYGFYVIQDDALCVRVSAKSGENEQKTVLWDLNRYTNLTEGNDTSYVFFGNDEFILSTPPPGIGDVTSLEVETGDFGGYTIEANGDGYSVNFLSDFYDDITVDLKINGLDRQIRIRRVGVDIVAYEWEEEASEFATVSHGTQSSTIIDFSGNDKYKIYATYCIPENGDQAPYGLYVVYTWADGSKTTDIITEPCSTPAPMAYDIFSDGVFHYANHADSCDYLLYSGESKAQAPVKINVTVLKGDPAASGSFSGVFFGSGAGVEWVKEEDE